MSTRCIMVLLPMVPSLPPPPLVSREDNAHSKNANNSPTASMHAVCRELKAHALLGWPLLAGHTGSKDSKGKGSGNNGNAGGGGQELDCAPDWDGPPLPPPQALA